LEAFTLQDLTVHGAREHNLDNVSLTLPRNQFIVFTGVSGSGKSTLAFDTIYAEGQRRYVESLSAYARQFLGVMDKPDVDSIEGLSPAISIDQKTTSHNPRSTVGTVTEIHDYLRLLFARAGTPHCPVCDREIARQSASEIVDRIMREYDGERALLLAPVVRHRKGEHKTVFEALKAEGYARVRVDGEVLPLDEAMRNPLERYETHDIDAVVDRIRIKEDERARIAESVELTLKRGNHQPQPTQHGGHRDGDSRLPAVVVRSGGDTALSRLRPRDRAAVRQRDCRSDHARVRR